MAGASGRCGVVIAAVREAGLAILEQEVESACNELLPEAHQVVIAELVDYEYQNQFWAAGVARRSF